MELPINPYIAGNPVGGTKNFVGRDNLLNNVYRVLADPDTNAIVLHGQRRIGKTSILLELVHRWPQTGPYLPVYFDLQDKAAFSLTDILNSVALKIAKILKLDRWTHTKVTPNTFESQFLRHALDVLPPNSHLVLLFDEFDVLDNPRDDQAAVALFPYLRQLMECVGPRIQFVFAVGRQSDDLPSQGNHALQDLVSINVSRLNREDTERLVQLSQQGKSTLTWHRTALERVWHLTNGDPYLTQQLCSVIWDKVYWDSDQRRDVSSGMVERAIPKTLERSLGSLQWIWDGLLPLERVVASALAEAGSEIVSGRKLAKTLTDRGVPIKKYKFTNALRQLEGRDFLEARKNNYRLRVELLRQWLVREKPLLETKIELDRVNPKAERLFKRGEDNYERDQLDKAAKQLTNALHSNENHLRARLLLGQIWLEQGEIPNTIKVLKRAYQYHPVEARPDYVRALLAQAYQTRGREQQSKIYKHILQIEPNQPLALRMQERLARKDRYEPLSRNGMAPSYSSYTTSNGEANNLSQTSNASQEGDSVQKIKSLSKKLSKNPDNERAQAALLQILNNIPMRRSPSQTTEVVTTFTTSSLSGFGWVASRGIHLKRDKVVTTSVVQVRRKRLKSLLQALTLTHLVFLSRFKWIAASRVRVILLIVVVIGLQVIQNSLITIPQTVSTKITSSSLVESSIIALTLPEPLMGPPLTQTPEALTSQSAITTMPRRTSSLNFTTERIVENYDKLEVMQEVGEHTGSRSSLAFSSDESFLASVDRGPFSPNGRLLSTDSKDTKIHLLDIDKGRISDLLRSKRYICL